jgi:HK97 gp10 family phage protein
MSATLDLKTDQAREKLVRTIVFHLNSAAASVETIARELAPVDTGNLKANIKQTEFATEDSLSVAIESGAEYSLYVEYGTVHSSAQPFLTPAFESGKRQLDRVGGVF